MHTHRNFHFRIAGEHIKLSTVHLLLTELRRQYFPGLHFLLRTFPAHDVNVHDPRRRSWPPVTKCFPGRRKTPAKASFLAATVSCTAFRCASSRAELSIPGAAALTFPAADRHEQPRPERNDTLESDPHEQGGPRREAGVGAKWRPRARNNRKGRHSDPRSPQIRLRKEIWADSQHAFPQSTLPMADLVRPDPRVYVSV